MFRAIVETQWKWTRGYSLVATLIAFALPLASLASATRADRPEYYYGDETGALYVVTTMQRWGVWYALLAAALGLVVAFLAWSHDHRGRHVYALTLPVTRARYALMRFGAGALFLAPTVAAVLLAALIVAVSGAIPQGLQVYPFALTLRFAFAALVAYSLFFAIASSTPRAAGIVLSAVAALLLAQYALSLADAKFDLLRAAVSLLFDSPGVFSVFTGRWMLIDA